MYHHYRAVACQEWHATYEWEFGGYYGGIVDTLCVLLEF